jgi:hypothetical protein
MLASAGTLAGTVLLLLPWLPSWDQNFFSGSGEAWFSLWMSPHFRGAISGIGALTVYVAMAEAIDLFRGPKA